MTPPPLLLLAAYRLFGWRLGPAYKDWTYADITRRGYTFRQALPVGLVIGALLAVLFAATGSNPARAIVPVVVVVALAFLMRRTLAERALRQQGLAPNGDVAAAWFDDDRARHGRNIASAATTSVLVLAGLTILAIGRG